MSPGNCQTRMLRDAHATINVMHHSHHRNLHALVLVLACLAPQCPAYGNPAPIGSPGTYLLPFSLKTIPGVAIAEETLTIRDGAKSSLPSFSPGGKPMEVRAIEYRAVYRFQNRTSRARTIKVGFPIVTYIHRAGDSNGGLTSFDIRFGGRRIPHRELSRSTPSLYPKADLQDIADDLVSANLVNIVSEAPDFLDLRRLGKSAAEAERLLKSSKKLSAAKVARVMKVLGETAFGDGDWAVRQQSLVWYAFDLELHQGISKPLEVSYKSISSSPGEDSITYLLRTAKYWNGPIGQLRIVFEPDKSFLSKGGRYDIHPKRTFFEQVDGRFAYKAKNAVPKFDIQIKRIKSEAL